MAMPAWIPDNLAALMLAVAAVSAARLTVASPRRRGAIAVGIDAAHLLMAIAMAGKLAVGLTTLPGAAWEAVFGLLTAWLAFPVCRDAAANGVRALAGGQCAPHLVHAGAMLYMFAALAAPVAGGPGTGDMGGQAMRTLEYPTLAFVFALLLAGYSVWDLDQLSGSRYRLADARLRPATASVPAPVGPGFAPAVFSGSQATAGLAAGAPPVPAPGSEAVTADGAPGSGPVARMVLLSPGMTVVCRIAMGVTMAFMLLIMI